MKKQLTLLITVALLATTAFAQEAKFIAVLKSAAPQKEKADACRELARIGTKDAVPTLAALLTDEKLSHMARYALEPIPTPAVDDALIAAMDKVTGDLRIGIISSLGVRRSVKAVEPLIKLLPDAAAASALARIGTTAAVQALERGLPGTAAACQVVAEKTPALYQKLLGAQIPEPIRQGAMRGAIVTGRNAPAMIEKALRGEDFAMAAIAVRASMELPGANITRMLAGAVGNLEDDRKLLVVQALGMRGDAAAVGALIPLAKAGLDGIRLAAIRSLVQIGNGAAVPVLIELSLAPEVEIANAARAGLAGLPGTETEQAIVALLKDREPQKRRIAIELVGQRRMTSALPRLLKMATDDDATVSIASLKVLAEMAGEAEIPALINILLTTKQPAAAESALTAVCGRRTAISSKCVDALSAAFEKSSGAPQLALLRALRSVGGPQALTVARSAAKIADPVVRETGLRCLCEWPGVEALPDVAALAKSATDEKVKILALRNYIQLVSRSDAPASERLAQLMDMRSLVTGNAEKKQMLAAMGELPVAEALTLVMQDVSNAELKEEACLAAVAIAEKIAGKQPSQVNEAMQEVVKASENDRIVKRARALVTTESKWTPLFNGKDLDGWKQEGAGIFNVVDDCLVGTQTDGKGGDLFTTSEYDNFEVRFTYKVKWPANSGIWFRGQYQFDILKYKNPVAYSGTLYCPGKLFLTKNPDESIENRDGWNEGRIFANGDRLALWLNGKSVGDCRDKTHSKGKVGIQVHGGNEAKNMEIIIKRIEIRPLAAEEEPQ